MPDIINTTRTGTWKRTQCTKEPINAPWVCVGTGTFDSGIVHRRLLNKSPRVNNPRSDSGWRAPSAYSVTDTAMDEYLYGARSTWFWGSTYRRYNLEEGYIVNYGKPVWASNSTIPTWMVSRAETRCLKKLKDQNVNYAVALAESRKSVGLIGQTLHRVFAAYKNAKKFRWKAAAAALGIPRHTFKRGSKDLAGRWLELQYGWLPLLSDMYGAYEDARRGIVALDTRISVKHTVRENLPENSRKTTTLGMPCSHVNEGFRLVKVRLDYTVKADALKQASRMGLTNPAVVAWELVPFSFVLDWALPIGEWLDSFDAAYGLTFIGGSRTTLVKAKQRCHVERDPVDPPSWAGSSSYFRHAVAKALYVETRFNRTVYSSTPWPLPYFKNPVSTAHALNGLALLRALFR